MNEISKININGTLYDIRDNSMTGQNIAALLESVHYSSSTGGDTQPIYLGTCESAADATVKVATVDNSFSLVSGVVVSIKYTNTNTYSATEESPITLNVNNTGAKQIYYNASLAPTGTNTSIYGYAGRYITYIYDGEHWVWFGHGADSNTTYSAGTAALLTTGTNTTNRTWQAKILHDYISYPNLIYDVATQSTSGSISIDGSKPVHVITLTGNASAVTLSTQPAEGHSTHVFFYSTSQRTVAIAHNATTSRCPGATALSLTVKANGYVEVDFLKANGVIYVRGV